MNPPTLQDVSEALLLREIAAAHAEELGCTCKPEMHHRYRDGDVVLAVQHSETCPMGTRPEGDAA